MESSESDSAKDFGTSAFEAINNISAHMKYFSLNCHTKRNKVKDIFVWISLGTRINNNRISVNINLGFGI